MFRSDEGVAPYRRLCHPKLTDKPKFEIRPQRNTPQFRIPNFSFPLAIFPLSCYNETK